MEILYIALGLIAGLAVGFMLAKNSLKGKTQKQQAELDAQNDRILEESRQAAKRKLEEAEAQAKKITDEAEAQTEELKRRLENRAKSKLAESKKVLHNKMNEKQQLLQNNERKLKEFEVRLKQRKQDLQSKVEENKQRYEDIKRKESEVAKIKGNLSKQLELVEEQKTALKQRQERLAQASEEHIRALEKVAKLSEQEAKEELIKAIRDKAESEALSLVKERIEEAKTTANREAKKIVIQSIQRMAAEHAIENTVSVFNLESDDLKGQIIGREGRNIRALEAATGAEIVVDDTPEAIIISSFDPVRREVCRLSLQRLVADGRIHPARIEEVVAKTRKQLDEQIMEIGQRTVIDLNLHGMHNRLIRMVGRMRFRSSYGQNLLKHSIETANLCAIMAAELGLSKWQIKAAKRAGLLHDIGKVAEEETELSHAILGMKLCEKFGEKPPVVNAVGAHHDEVEMTSIISPLVQACDAISGARPGARREILESYIQRIKDLEQLALDYEGVQKVYAMQAGRELRVIVESEKVTDESAEDLSFKISQRIQDEMQYPGQIKITVIREKRAVAFAR